MKKRILIFMVLLFAVLIPCISAMDTSSLDTGTSTDWTLWMISGLLGLILFLFSLNASSAKAEVEVDAILSVMAWIPIAFCAYASFNVSRYIGIGTTTLYSFPIIGMLMIVFLVVAVGNTLRIIALHKVFRGEEQGQAQRQGDD